MRNPELRISTEEMIVDSFAGGGGASLGIEMALGRSPDIAINHNAEALAMHAVNHPNSRHICEDVWAVDPVAATQGKRVALMWLSPDCKHFSKAKGGKPVEKKTRGLAWIAVRWVKALGPRKPRVIVLENVEEFAGWGPLLEDGRPCPVRKGLTFRRFVKQLQNHGYVVDWQEIVAADFGTPTSRNRLYLIARCDGEPIVWPNATHGRGLTPWRTAAECIEWSIPCPSIFDRERPLADNTMRRIARGIKKYVIDAKEPFIVNLTHSGSDRVEPLAEPLRTITGAHRGEKALVRPYVARIGQTGGGDGGKVNDVTDPLSTIVSKAEHLLVQPFLAGVGGRKGQSPETGVNQPYHTITAKGDTALVSATLIDAAHSDESPTGVKRWGKGIRDIKTPVPTVTAQGGNSALVSAFLAKHYGGVTGQQMQAPTGTITSVDHHSYVAASLVNLRGTHDSQLKGLPIDQPLPTISGGGIHAAEVRAFLVAYYGNDKEGQGMREAMRTVTSKDRLGLVEVHGEEYQIADIGMRMLQPRELFRAQGFPDTYKIDTDAQGKPFSKSAQVRMCGNSVCPPVAAAIVSAQFASIEQGAVA